MSIIEPKIAARLKALPLKVRTSMIGSVAGMHRSPNRGSSLEFAEYRKYVPGDDTRRLDWRAYGRSDRYYIKEFEADTNLRLCLIVDTSGSMNYRAPGSRNEGAQSKLDYAKQLAGTLGFLAAGQGDAVGLYCAQETLKKNINPKRSAAHLRLVLQQLEAAQADGPTGLVDCLHEAAGKIRQRALVVIISDLFVDPQELKAAFGHLRFRKHEVAVFHLLEQQEIDFQFDRPTRFRDLEGGEPIFADPSHIANGFREAMQNYLTEIRALMRESGVADYHRVSLDQHYGDVLSSFLLARQGKS